MLSITKSALTSATQITAIVIYQHSTVPHAAVSHRLLDTQHPTRSPRIPSRHDVSSELIVSVSILPEQWFLGRLIWGPKMPVLTQRPGHTGEAAMEDSPSWSANICV
mmetsp:Transcript_5475/g.15687  ORF Transcript_5475/g.15687 Transcript_5475/m.15687 type:complete len:107 (-) Transcript_5475:1107-1427(-)